MRLFLARGCVISFFPPVFFPFPFVSSAKKPNKTLALLFGSEKGTISLLSCRWPREERACSSQHNARRQAAALQMRGGGRPGCFGPRSGCLFGRLSCLRCVCQASAVGPWRGRQALHGADSGQGKECIKKETLYGEEGWKTTVSEAQKLGVRNRNKREKRRALPRISCSIPAYSSIGSIREFPPVFNDLSCPRGICLRGTCGYLPLHLSICLFYVLVYMGCLFVSSSVCACLVA